MTMMMMMMMTMTKMIMTMTRMMIMTMTRMMMMMLMMTMMMRRMDGRMARCTGVRGDACVTDNRRKNKPEAPYEQRMVSIQAQAAQSQGSNHNIWTDPT